MSAASPTPTGNASDALSGAYLILFQRIYEEVVASARRVAEVMATPGMDPPPCNVVQQELVDFVERVAGDAVHLPPMNERRVAIYVIVAMADEVFLRAPRLASWPGRMEWAAHPLEQQLFHTHTSGERFFDYIDGALSNRAPFSRDLFAVFLTALALGFCGRYATGAEPEGYRARIAERLGYDAHDGGDDGGHADMALFLHTARVPARRVHLPAVINGVYPIFAVLALWLLGGLVIWQIIARPLNHTLDAIEAAP